MCGKLEVDIFGFQWLLHLQVQLLEGVFITVPCRNMRLPLRKMQRGMINIERNCVYVDTRCPLMATGMVTFC